MAATVKPPYKGNNIMEYKEDLKALKKFNLIVDYGESLDPETDNEYYFINILNIQVRYYSKTGTLTYVEDWSKNDEYDEYW